MSEPGFQYMTDVDIIVIEHTDVEENDTRKFENETTTILVTVCQYSVLTRCWIILVSGIWICLQWYYNCKDDFRLALEEAKTAHKNKCYKTIYQNKSPLCKPSV
jgi:hypothetical protein